MRNTDFKVLQQCYGIGNSGFLLVIEIAKDCDFKFIGKYVRENEKIYQVSNDVPINETMHILVCYKVTTMGIFNLDHLHINDFGIIDDYFKKEIL